VAKLPTLIVRVLLVSEEGEVCRVLEETIRDLRNDIETLKRVAAVREKNN